MNTPHTQKHWPYFVGIALWCLLMVALPWLTVQVWHDQLPDQLARHWGFDGKANEFEPRDQAWWFAAWFVPVLSAFLLALAVGMKQIRAILPVIVGMATGVGVLSAVGIYTQVGLADSRNADSGLAVVVGPICGLVAGIGAALLQRALWPRRTTPRVGPLPHDALTLDVPGGIPITWTGRPRQSKPAHWGAALALLPLVALVVMFAAFGQWAPAALLALVGLALVALLAIAFTALVMVDARGLSLRTFGRFTVTSVPLEMIESATTTTVYWGEFGGLGLRSRIDTDGSMGLVTSSGPALQVNRTGTGPFFVTIDHAEQAASVVNTLVARQVSQPRETA